VQQIEHNFRKLFLRIGTCIKMATKTEAVIAITMVTQMMVIEFLSICFASGIFERCNKLSTISESNQRIMIMLEIFIMQ